MKRILTGPGLHLFECFDGKVEKGDNRCVEELSKWNILTSFFLPISPAAIALLFYTTKPYNNEEFRLEELFNCLLATYPKSTREEIGIALYKSLEYLTDIGLFIPKRSEAGITFTNTVADLIPYTKGYVHPHNDSIERIQVIRIIEGVLPPGYNEKFTEAMQQAELRALQGRVYSPFGGIELPIASTYRELWDLLSNQTHGNQSFLANKNHPLYSANIDYRHVVKKLSCVFSPENLDWEIIRIIALPSEYPIIQGTNGDWDIKLEKILLVPLFPNWFDEAMVIRQLVDPISHGASQMLSPPPDQFLLFDSFPESLKSLFIHPIFREKYSL